MSPLTIALLCTGLLLLVIILWVIVSHNGFVRLRNLVQEAWRQIDVELNRRHDLIPNLLGTVRGYMSYEQSTLQAVVEARRLAEAPAANLAQRARNEDALSGALSRLIALSENYPTLRADSSFLQLQQELTNTEDRIAAGRRFYNSNVRDLNTKCEKFPSLIIASIFHFRHAEYFEVHDEASRAVPQVSFGGQPQPGQFLDVLPRILRRVVRQETHRDSAATQFPDQPGRTGQQVITQIDGSVQVEDIGLVQLGREHWGFLLEQWRGDVGQGDDDGVGDPDGCRRGIEVRVAPVVEQARLELRQPGRQHADPHRDQ